MNFSSKEDAAGIFIQGEAEDCPAPLRVIQDYASLSNDGCVSGEMSKLAGMSFAEIRAQWGEVQTRLNPAATVALACALAERFPNNGFFEAQALALGREHGMVLPVARRLVELGEAGVRVPLHPITVAVEIIESDPSTNEAERERAVALADREIEASPRRHYFRAIRHRRGGAPDAAFEEVQLHLEIFPEDSEAIVLCGVLASQTGRLGRYARQLAALKPYGQRPGPRRAFAMYEGLARAQGLDPSNPDDVARYEDQMETPGGAYEAAIRTAPPPDRRARSGVAFLIGSLAGGGAERVVATTVRSLRSRQPSEDVRLWLMNREMGTAGDPMFYLPLTGMTQADLTFIEAAAEPEEPFAWLPPFYATRAQSIYTELCRLRPRVFYITLDEAVIAGGLAAVMAGVPKIVLHCHNMSPPSLHGSDTHSFGWDRAYRALLSRPNVHYVNVSRTALDDYIRWARIDDIHPPERVRVIHNGVDFSDIAAGLTAGLATPVRQDLGIPPGAPVIGTALRFSEVKQPLLWLEAARLIRDAQPTAHFVMYGDGVLLEECQSYASALGLDECVHFPGRVSDLAHRLPLFDIFMLSSRSEGFPNVLIEAQAAGVVPVAFDVGGCRETMAPERTGRIVRGQAAETLAAAVIELLQDPVRLNRMKRDGKEFVRDEFSLERMVAQISSVIGMSSEASASQSPANQTKSFKLPAWLRKFTGARQHFPQD